MKNKNVKNKRKKRDEIRVEDMSFMGMFVSDVIRF